MPIAEPMTTITDYLLGLEAAWLGWILCSGRRNPASAARWLGGALLATAVGAFAGGASHGFAPWLDGSPLDRWLWYFTLLCIGATSLLFLWSVARAALTGGARRILQGLAVAEFAVYAFWILDRDAFIWAIADFVPAMAVALVLFGREALAARPGARAVVAGILLTFVGAAIQASGFALHRHFNHNDLFHLIQMVSVYWLYRGGLVLQDRETDGGSTGS